MSSSDTGERCLADEAATAAAGRGLARHAAGGGIVFLEGDLGMGKTSLCRGLLRALGHQGPVRSPTFTLVESYATPIGEICHFDLYRLGDPGELELIGLRDYLAMATLCLIEWPERGCGVLPVADLVLRLEPAGPGRCLRWRSNTARGRRLAEGLVQAN
jgi:tRNA threonylcarbamoyladenosine biosynthesis protein TsaE